MLPSNPTAGIATSIIRRRRSDGSSRRRFLKIAGIAALGLGHRAGDRRRGRFRRHMGRSPAYAQKGDDALAKALGHGDRHHASCSMRRYRTHHRGVPRHSQRPPLRKQATMKSSGSGKPIITMPSRTMPTNYLSGRDSPPPFPGALQPLRRIPPACGPAPPRRPSSEPDGIVLMDFTAASAAASAWRPAPTAPAASTSAIRGPSSRNQPEAFPPAPRAWWKSATSVRNAWRSVNMPACVEASDGAIVFGDLDDPDSEVREVLRENYTIRRKQSSLGPARASTTSCEVAMLE
jgi:hypothetical protein